MSNRLVALVLTMIFPWQAQAQVDDAQRFGLRESAFNVSLSPDGTKVAFLEPASGKKTALMVASASGGGASKIVLTSDGEPWRLSWCAWASNTRLACKLYGIMDDVAAGSPLSFTRMVAVDADGSQLKALSKSGTSRTIGFSQFDSGIIGWPEDDSGSVLMERAFLPEVTIGSHIASDKEGLGVERVNTLTLRSSIEEQPKPNVSAYIADTKGNIRIMRIDVASESGLLKGVSRYYYRNKESRVWKEFSVTSEQKPGLIPVAVDEASNSAFAIGQQNGRDAIFKVLLDDSLAATLVHADPAVDVNEIITLGRTGRVIGARVVKDKAESVIFDAGYKSFLAKISKALPNLPLVSLVSASRDEGKLLLFAGSDKDPGRYFLFDKTTRQLSELMLARPDLEGKALADVKPISFPAADGTRIPGYLTLPPGSSGKKLPAIVMPHGGPAARDEWGFDWLAQFYVSQGYAVLQPNYRGSSGYGNDWYVENGFKSWRTSIGDVNDAGRWLVAEGIADASKLAAVGWSYGGYAVLQSNVIAPDLFKAVVAIAPVTDLSLLVQQSRGFTNEALVARYVGSGEHIASGSPRRHAAQIKAPVLMFSGDKDLNVDIGHAKAMDKALKDAGKETRLITYPGLDHGLHDSTVRADMLRQSAAFLKLKLGL